MQPIQSRDSLKGSMAVNVLSAMHPKTCDSCEVYTVKRGGREELEVFVVSLCWFFRTECR